MRAASAPTCPVCGEPGALAHRGLVDRILTVPGEWSIRECSTCRRAWLDPRPIDADLGLLYVGAYMTHTVNERGGRSLVHRVRDWYLGRAYGDPSASAVRRWLRRLSPLDRLFGGDVAWLPAVAGGQLLDMGCGSGAFLASMRSRGWRVVGVESDPAARDAARSRAGLEVVDAVESLGDRTFEAIVLHHVVEHLPDPRETLTRLARRLAPGGRLVMVTPNLESLGRRVYSAAWVHWDPPRHLHVFSRRSLAVEIERAGLGVERAFTTGRYARFVGVEGVRIRRSGRVGTSRAPTPLRLFGLLFQLTENVLGIAVRSAGEELVVIARRPA